MQTNRTTEPIRLRTTAERATLGAAAAYVNRRYESGLSDDPTRDSSRWADGEGELEESVIGTHRQQQPEDAYVEQLPAARRTVCHRLVRGLLRGKPDGLPPHEIRSIDDPELPDEVRHHVERIDDCGPTERTDTDFEDDRTGGSNDHSRTGGNSAHSNTDRDRTVAILPLPASKAILVASIRERHGYDRFRLDGPILLVNDGRVVSDPHPTDLVSLLHREGAVPSREHANRIADEMAESVANLAFARLAAPAHAAPNIESATSSTAASIVDHLDVLPGADPTSSLERLTTDGHPFHPAAKIRRGMTPAESLRYAPEFTDTIHVRFVAVDDEFALRRRTDTTLTDILYDCFPGLSAAVERAVSPVGSPATYSVVPVHPWQYVHVIRDRYADAISEGRVIPIPESTWPATPLLNLRTVVPYASSSSRHPPHLKLAVNVQLTNVVRTVSPQAVFNGPLMTTVLEAIWKRESFESLGVLSEVAATSFHAPGGPHPTGDAFDDARNLAAIARQNPYSHPLVPDGGTPITVSSLLADSPGTGQPIICDVLDRFRKTHDGYQDRASTIEFFEAYVDAVVPEQLSLLVKYGIALETHPQNACVVFTDGHPVATLARDLGGIRVLNDRLLEHSLEIDFDLDGDTGTDGSLKGDTGTDGSLDFENSSTHRSKADINDTFVPYPDSDLDATNSRDLYNKLYYALFQNHLTEVIVTLVKHTSLDEADCWEVVRTSCRDTFESLRSDDEIPTDWIDEDEAALFENPTTHKALTAMRLAGKRHEYVTSTVSNPLSPPSERRGSNRRVE